MIDITDVKKVLNGNLNDNTICYEYELRPSIIVSAIKSSQILQTIMDTFSMALLKKTILSSSKAYQVVILSEIQWRKL